MRKNLTEEGVRRLRPTPGKQVDYFDQRVTGLILRVSYGGQKTWRCRYYESKKVKTHRLGQFPADPDNPVVGDLSVKAAREAARRFDPSALIRSADKLSVTAVAEDFLKRHVEAKNLRTKAEITRCVRKYIIAEWGSRAFVEIRRGEVTRLLDKIEDTSGKRMADIVLSIFRKMANWHASRVDDYQTPIVPGMRRGNPAEHHRKRILSDAEIVALWTATDRLGSFGALVKLLLLTGQRREKVASIQWTDIDDGVWTIRTEPREKQNAGKLDLPDAARKLIRSQAKVERCPFVFPASSMGRGKSLDDKDAVLGHFNSFSQQALALNAMMRESVPEMERWTLHDLRRTARSLLSRAGISSDIAERTLGHAIIGVEGIYDRHDYFKEKGMALARLAELIAAILNPPQGNIVTLAERRAG